MSNIFKYFFSESQDHLTHCECVGGGGEGGECGGVEVGEGLVNWCRRKDWFHGD